MSGSRARHQILVAGFSYGDLLARPRVSEPCRQMGLQPLGGTGKVELHVPPSAVDVVSEDVQLRAISLCLDSHSILRL